VISCSRIEARIWSRLVFPGVALLLSLVEPAFPADGRAASKEPTNIPAQPVGKALETLARSRNFQIVYFSEDVGSLRSAGAAGELTTDEALDQILAGTGLAFRYLDDHTVAVVANPAGSDAKPLSSVTPRPAVAKKPALEPEKTGEKSDPIAEVVISRAEGLVATRVPTPLREIPQTIGIISHEQIREQNDTDLGDALANAAGITVVRTDSLATEFYSRGFKVTSFHIDGGAALFNYSDRFPSLSSAAPGILTLSRPDLSEFDHIELLRGADALFGANSNPGATVSMVRKRPLGTYQLAFDGEIGSWENRRMEIDATGPMAFDGALRGRIDGVYADEHYFYRTAESRRRRLFAVLEGEVTPSTVLTLGGSYQWDGALPAVNGLPFNLDLTDPHLSRSTSLTFDWATYQSWAREMYFQLRQAAVNDWRVQVNAASWSGSAEYAFGYFLNSIDPASRVLPGALQVRASNRPNTLHQYTVDLTISGSHEWFGHHTEVAVGADFTRLFTRVAYDYFTSSAPINTQAASYNPDAIRDPRITSEPQLGLGFEVAERRGGLFVSVRTSVTDKFSIIGGARLSDNRDDFTLSSLVSHRSAATHDDFGNPRIFTPYLGAMCDLSNHLSLYASYADIYHSSLVGIEGVSVPPNYGANVEVGIKGAWRDNSLNGSLVAYRIEQTSRDFVFDGSQQAAARFGTNSSEGVDLELNGWLQDGWRIGSGYTYNVNRSAAGGSLASWTPRHLLKLWTSLRLPGIVRNWTVGGNLRAQSGYESSGTYCPIAFNDESCPVDSGNFVLKQSSYAVVDLRVSHQINAHWRAALSLNNVFDHSYFESLGTPSSGNWYGAPRSFLLRLDAHF
jgi:outer membrane receptor for ferric coprogen and ferric-rhodotorulic acid